MLRFVSLVYIDRNPRVQGRRKSGRPSRTYGHKQPHGHGDRAHADYGARGRMWHSRQQLGYRSPRKEGVSTGFRSEAELSDSESEECVRPLHAGPAEESSRSNQVSSALAARSPAEEKGLDLFALRRNDLHGDVETVLPNHDPSL